ncbi:MAG: CarD family transcriptional regulator, partial [Dongiaceae bacterium]
MSELVLDEARIASFRESYRVANPHHWRGDPLYEAVSAGQRFIGMEQWLPLFYDGLETLFHYVPGAAVTLDHQAEPAVQSRLEQIAEYYAVRRGMAEKNNKGADRNAFVYRPVPPGGFYLDLAEWHRRLAERPVAAFSPFSAPADGQATTSAGYHASADFAEARRRPDINLFDAVRDAIASLHGVGKTVAVAAFTAGSRARLAALLQEHGVADAREIVGWAEIETVPRDGVAVAELPIERGFSSERLAIITEQDILGDRLVRRPRRRRRTEAFITELSSLNPGDLVVHEDHGIGRYEGLETLDVGGAPHDCLRIAYGGGGRLFLPVENIELLSRYGSEEAAVELDKLGGAGWQQRKARVKQRIAEIADKLLAIAAERQLKPGAVLEAPPGLFDEFAARFPYAETDEQQRAIDEVLADLVSGKPMDRLVCG